MINKKDLHVQVGFTIIEVTIAGSLMVVLGIAILNAQQLITDSQVFGFKSAQSIDEASFAINQIAKELRTLRNADNGSFPIVYGSNNELIFYSDFNNDGNSERVRYSLDGNILTRGVIKPTGFPAQYLAGNEQTRILSENVTNDTTALFMYFNEDWPKTTSGNPLTAPINVSEPSLIKIYINIKGYEVSTSVQLRKLKDNL